MSNTITIELCAEDRARLDRLTAALEAKVAQDAPAITNVSRDSALEQLAAAMANASIPPEPPQEPQDEPKAESKENAQPAEETATASEPAAEVVPETEEPAVTLEQIQKKVTQLVAGFGGAKKSAVREIITAYGTKVSDLKEHPDKWTEVWNKLTALESEA